MAELLAADVLSEVLGPLVRDAVTFVVCCCCAASLSCVVIDRLFWEVAYEALFEVDTARLRCLAQDGAIERTCLGDVLRVRMEDGMGMDIMLASRAARQCTLPSVDGGWYAWRGFPLVSCFFQLSYVGNLRTTYPNPPREATLVSLSDAVLRADEKYGLYNSGLVTRNIFDPGNGDISRVWCESSPLDWEPGDGPLRSDVQRGQFHSRLCDESVGEPGLACLWLRHLPSWFIHRMACVSMAWADAAGTLLSWRATLDAQQEAFEYFGEPDEWLIFDAEEWGAECAAEAVAVALAAVSLPAVSAADAVAQAYALRTAAEDTESDESDAFDLGSSYRDDLDRLLDRLLG